MTLVQTGAPLLHGSTIASNGGLLQRSYRLMADFIADEGTSTFLPLATRTPRFSTQRAEPNVAMMTSGPVSTWSSIKHRFGFSDSSSSSPQVAGMPPTPEPVKEESQVNPYAAHQEELKQMMSALELSSGEEKSALAFAVAAKIEQQIAVYSQDYQNAPGKSQQALVVKSSANDLQVMLKLMYHWEARNHSGVQRALAVFDETHYKLENNKFKLVPVYWLNNINNSLTLLMSIVYLGAMMQLIPGLHDLIPSVFTDSPANMKHFSGAEIWKKFVGTMQFGLPYVALYGGTEGFFCKNTNGAVSRVHNAVLDKLTKPISFLSYGAAGFVDESMHQQFGKYWDPISTFIYVGSKQGVLGVSKWIAHCMPNKTGTAAGMALEIGMGAIGNVANSIIFKDTSGLGLIAKFGKAALKPVELLVKEVGPSIIINVLMSYANTRVTQYGRNDVVAATIHRMFMGVMIKGGPYNAVNSLNADGGFATSALVWGAQFVIGFVGTAYSRISTNDKLRDRLERRLS